MGGGTKILCGGIGIKNIEYNWRERAEPLHEDGKLLELLKLLMGFRGFGLDVTLCA